MPILTELTHLSTLDPGLLAAATNGSEPLHWEDLGLQQGIQIGPFLLRYYSLAYLVGILGGYWLLTRMIRRPGAPMDRDQLDSLIFLVIIGIIGGGRLGYAAFYQPSLFTSLDLFKPWEGGMSFHGGLIGVLLAVGWIAWRHRLDVLRVTDYVATVVPLGMFLGRIANFINGELWGRPSDVPWAMVFPGGGDVARHPSQLYQAGLEGLLVLLVISWLFWRTRARFRPGLLAGVYAIGVGLSRFVVEFFREPDSQLTWLVEATGLSMGQWLTVPLILLGVFLVWRALSRPEVAVQAEEHDAAGREGTAAGGGIDGGGTDGGGAGGGGSDRPGPERLT